MQHQRPAAEHLLREELGEHAVAHAFAGRRRETDRRCCRAARTPRSSPKNTRSASCDAHAGNHVGQLLGRTARRLIGRHACSTSRRSDRESPAAPGVGRPGPVRCCSSLTAFSVCRMLSAAESTWLLRKSGILPVDRHLGQRLNLAFDAIELDRDELGVLLRAPVVVEAQLAHRDAVLQRLDDAVVAALLCAAARFLRSSSSRVVDLLLVHRLQEPVERGLRQQQPQEQPQQPIEPGRPDLFGAAGLVAGRAAHAGGDAAHLEAARVQPLEPRARARRAARRASSPATPAAAARPRPLPAPAARRGPWRRSRRGTAAPRPGRRGRSARPPPPAAAGPARAASAPRRPRRRGRTAGSTGRETLP